MTEPTTTAAKPRSLYDKAFWTAALERAIRTLAQALLAFIGAGATGLLDINWPQALSVSGFAALLSILTSIAAGRVRTSGPSLGPETIARRE